VLPSGETTTFREVKLYNVIFRTLETRREADGSLYFTNPKTRERQKFSATALYEATGNQFQGFVTSPLRYLEEHGKTLLEQGLFRPEDFRSITTRGYYLADRYRTEKLKPDNQPNVMLKGVQYYIGREAFIFEGKRIPSSELKVVMLDEETAGIVQMKLGRESLVASFPLATDGEISRKKSELEDRGITNLDGRVFLGKPEMNKRLSEWDPTEENPPLKDETHQSYARRIRHLADYENIRETSKMFSDSAKIGIHNLSWREQQWLCSGIFSSPGKTDEIIRFGKKFGLDGLRTFLSCEYDVRNSDAILSIGKQLPEEIATSIFEKYGALVEAANAVEEQLHEKFRVVPGYSKEVAIRISQNLLRKGRDLLVSLAKTSERNPEKIAATLDAIKADIELFKSAFRILYEEGVIENFEDVSGVEFGTKSPEELSDEDKATMRKMYDENYPESAGYSKEFREAIFHGLEGAFTKKEGVRFYVLKKDDEMLGYNRFEDLPDTEDGRKRKYVGSFNVAPQYQGSKLGDKIFDDCLAQEISEDTVIEAYADPTIPISSHYLETNGFVATGIEDIGGRPLLKIIRDPKMNAGLATKKSPQDKEELTRLAEEGHISIRKMPRGDIPWVASDLLGKGWLLTHITRDAGDKSAVAAVFEKPR